MARKRKCIRCGEGGEVLVCREQVCQLPVHEKCMNCSAAFDDKGSFFCPYCWYRRTIVQANEARKRAMSAKGDLSTFLDTSTTTLFSNQQKQKTESSTGKELPTASARIFDENAYRSDPHEVCNQSVQAEKYQEDVLAEGFEQHQVVAKHQLHMRSSVGHGDDNLYGREEGTKSADESFQGFVANQKFDGLKQLVAVKVGGTVQKELPGEVNDLQNEGVAEGQQEPEPLNECHLEEETTLHDDFSVLNKGKHVDARKTKENLAGRKGEEIQPQAQKITATLPRGDPTTLVHGKANIEFGMIDSRSDTRTLLTNKRHVAVKSKSEMGSQNVDSQKKSSSGPDINAENNAGEWTEEVIISRKSIQPQRPSKQLRNQNFPNDRRKRLLWRSDEEEMLKVLGYFEAYKSRKRTAMPNLVHIFPWFYSDAQAFQGLGYLGYLLSIFGLSVCTFICLTGKEAVGSILLLNFVLGWVLIKRVKKDKKQRTILPQEGVHQFGATGDKNIPWRKILDFGRHIFDRTRNPVDLKDKWRTMLAKES